MIEFPILVEDSWIDPAGVVHQHHECPRCRTTLLWGDSISCFCPAPGCGFGWHEEQEVPE